MDATNVGSTAMDIEAVLAQAGKLRSAGRLEEAIRHYLAVLDHRPAHRPALKPALQLLHRQGDMQGAEQVMRNARNTEPQSPDLQKFCGDVYRHFGSVNRALSHYRQALRLRPAYPEAHLDLGALLALQGQHEKASTHYRKALDVRPDFTEAGVNLAICLTRLGKAAQAVPLLGRILDQHPDFFEARLACGQALAALGRQQDAIPHLEAAVRLRPGMAGPLNTLGMTLRAIGHAGAAVACFREALRLVPDNSDAMQNLAAMLLEKRQHGEAELLLARNLQLRPDDAAAHYAMGFFLDWTGRKQEARGCYHKALALDPQHIGARWGTTMSWLRVLYGSEADIERSRRKYERGLRDLETVIDFGNPEAVAMAERAILAHLPFLLPYQGRNDAVLQQRYGRLVTHVMASRYPGFTAPLADVSLDAGDRIRVGFVSACFHDHSNWKVPIRGWVENLDRTEFELYGYYTRAHRDASTARAEAAFDRFIHWQGLEQMAATIRSHRLHAVIFPEIGMSGEILCLAAMRLAPVQCVSWGHPVTSGLPGIDYFLSSDAMEPAGADQDYSETLVRLSGLSIHYTPLEPLAAAPDRAAFGLADDAVVYLCTQSLSKYLPQYDVLFPAIARQVPRARFVFIAHRGAEQITALFRNRLHGAFAESGLEAERHVTVLPVQDPARYQALNRLADIYLDSIAWSGCNTALEAIGQGLPVITACLPGQRMRAYHCRAILETMAMPDHIAITLADYIRLAVAAGLDPGWRAAARDRILANREHLYRDAGCIRALEAFLRSAVRQFTRN